MSTHWIRICHIDDIIPLGSRRVRRPRGPDVAIFRTADNAVFALLDRCPHKGGPLSQGLVHGHHVACPLHNWNIGLSDGQVQAPDQGCVPRFVVNVDAGQVFLDAVEMATLGVDLPLPIAGPHPDCHRIE